MKKFIFYILLLSFFVSCKSAERGVSISDLLKYENNEGYKNLYIVDTIKIDNPIRFITEKGHQFVMSKKTFESFDGKEKLLFKRRDAYLLEDDLPMDLPHELYSKYAKGSPCYEYSKSEKVQKKGINNVYSYIREPDYFLLILIRGDYYNQVYSGIDGPPIINWRKGEFVYYKVVIPFCFK